MPIVDFGASTGTLEFRKSTLGAAAVAAAVGSDFDLVSSFFVINYKSNKKILLSIQEYMHYAYAQVYTWWCEILLIAHTK